MKKINCTLFLLFIGLLSFAQTARVQIIHNSPSPKVDIYANDDLLLNNFVFRTATPFIDVPAEVLINIGVAPADSDSAADAIANFPVTLADGGTYVVVASGIVGGNPGFDLSIFDMATETADDDDNVGLLFFHGSPDAPTIDILTGGTPIIDDASFGDFQGYLNVPADNTYILDITPGNDNSTIVASYEADFDFWDGKTAVIFASGFLSGDDPEFEPWVALSSGGTFPLDQIDNTPPPPPATTARVQIIHNSPSPTVDIYANDDKLLNNFVFRTATPFMDVPADVLINIGVAPKTSSSAADAIANFPVTFEAGKTYVVVASGIVGGNPGFDLSVFDMGTETADDEDNVGLLFFHGSPDAPTIDILTGGTPIIDDASFGDFQGYLNVPADNTYILDITPGNDNSTIVASYEADFDFWDGKTAVIFASGFLSGDDPEFEPWVALSSGGTFPLDQIDNTPPPPPATTARVQIIHNSPSPTVDIYANDDKLLNNFVFRTATPFMDVPADVLINIGVAPKTSSSAADAIANFPVTFEAGKTYVVVASGIVGGNPGFDLSVFDMATETADDEDNVGILFFHGSPDAPTIDILVGGSPIIDDASFGDFQGYLNVPADNTYTLDITPGNDNATIVASYEADLDFWDGKTAVIFASGFLSGDDPEFEPWVALSSGGTFPLDAANNFGGTSPQSLVSNASTGLIDKFEIIPNPAVDRAAINLNLEMASTVFISVSNNLGQIVQTQNLGLQPKGFVQTELALNQLPTGSYYITVQLDNNLSTKTMMILRD